MQKGEEDVYKPERSGKGEGKERSEDREKKRREGWRVEETAQREEGGMGGRKRGKRKKIRGKKRSREREGGGKEESVGGKKVKVG